MPVPHTDSASGNSMPATSSPTPQKTPARTQTSPLHAIALLFERQPGLASVLCLLLVCVLTFSLCAPSFLSVTNLLTILRQNAAAFISATAMTLVITTGGIDLSIGAVAAFSGITMAVLATFWHLPPAFALAGALLAGTVAGTANGLLITRVGMAPFIVTLATMSVFRGLSLLIAQGYSLPLPENAPLLEWPGRGWIGPVPVPALIMLACVAAGSITLHRTRFGRYITGIGSNQEGVRRTGVNVRRISLTVYALSGLAAALSGILMTGRLGSASSNIGVGFELDVIAAVVLGGTSLTGGYGTVIGSALGILTLACLKNGLILAHVSPFLTQIFTGLITIGAIWINMSLKGRDLFGIRKNGDDN
ncbi:ABC transporter permease [Acetobacter musti]|uniref:ABC transporter permease n=1 Tax=Acetobacter musti TaxID=864732 RepID=A0ABX0JIK2_9PROT|nr:ABC transporter permease [Acetobacter musti]NHN83249.1 ABC transporter permease [Acetobacter musti]